MTGLVVVNGNDRSPNETFIQVAGSAQRIAADDLRNAMNESPTLRLSLLRFAQAFAIQASYTSLANARGHLDARLARWLLMTHDRVDTDELPLKHDFLALMLGVHRPGVTVALKELESIGLINGRRGCIEVIDRKGLSRRPTDYTAHLRLSISGSYFEAVEARRPCP